LSQGINGSAVVLSGTRSTVTHAPAGENRLTPWARVQGTQPPPSPTVPAAGHDLHRHRAASRPLRQ